MLTTRAIIVFPVRSTLASDDSDLRQSS